MVNLEEVQRILDGLAEEFEDPEAQDYLFYMQDSYEMAVRAEYGLEKDGSEYDNEY